MMNLIGSIGKIFLSEDQNPQPKEDIQQESKIPRKKESKNSHCITLRGHISHISKPPKDFGFIKAKTPIRFDLKSVDVRPAAYKLTAGTVVYVDLHIDSQGGLYTEHIVALEEERLKERTYSEGVVQFVNSSDGFGKIMADVTIYYKTSMIPNAKIGDEAEVQAKIGSQGGLFTVSLPPPRTKKTAGKIKGIESGIISIRLLKGGEDSAPQSFSVDECKYEKPVVGDVVMVEYLEQEPSRILQVQKIPTQNGKIKQVTPEFGYIKLKKEAKEVYFARRFCSLLKPVKGDTVTVSYIDIEGTPTAVLVCRAKKKKPPTSCFWSSQSYRRENREGAE